MSGARFAQFMAMVCSPIEHHLFDVGLPFGYQRALINPAANLCPKIVPKIFAGTATFIGRRRRFRVWLLSRLSGIGARGYSFNFGLVNGIGGGRWARTSSGFNFMPKY